MNMKIAEEDRYQDSSVKHWIYIWNGNGASEISKSHFIILHEFHSMAGDHMMHEHITG